VFGDLISVKTGQDNMAQLTNSLLSHLLLSCVLFLSVFAAKPMPAQTDSVSYFEQKLEVKHSGKSMINSALGLVRAYQGRADIKKALMNARLAADEARRIGDSVSLGDTYISMSRMYQAVGEKTKALDYCLKAEKLLDGHPDRLPIVTLHKGELFYFSQDYKNAKVLFKLACIRAEARKDYFIEILAFIDIGNIYFAESKYDSALYSYKKCQSIPFDLDSIRTQILLSDIGNVYEEMKDLDEGERYLKKALALAERNKMKMAMPILYYNIAGVAFSKKHMKEAISNLRASISTGIQINDGRNLIYCYKLKARVDSALGLKDSVIADNYHYITINDSLNNATLFNKMAEMQARYDVDKKDIEIKLLNKDKDILNRDRALLDEKIRRQRIVTILVVVGLLIFCILSVFLFRNVIARKKANALLEIQNAEIEDKRKLLAEKNEKINDSITYAKRIQEAILPATLFDPEEVKEYFVFFKPKDIVSGDFYWRFRTGDEVFFALIDCTGHGVPGAMMSILGYDLLEYAVKEKGLREPAEILNVINARIIETLYKSNPTGAKDGMDLTLARLNLKTQELVYSGAKNDLLLISAGECIVLRVDKQSIGYNCLVPFTQASIHLKKTDRVYLFTDGFASQKGGRDGKKYMQSKFRDWLTANHTLPFEEQHSRLEEEFNSWKASFQQRDDVLVAGFCCG
jgi:serine phosphatase RsbU (regulator of sigma subunit)